MGCARPPSAAASRRAADGPGAATVARTRGARGSNCACEEIEVLQVAQAAVQDVQAVGGRRAAEVVAIDQGHPTARPRRRATQSMRPARPRPRRRRRTGACSSGSRSTLHRVRPPPTLRKLAASGRERPGASTRSPPWYAPPRPIGDGDSASPARRAMPAATPPAPQRRARHTRHPAPGCANGSRSPASPCRTACTNTPSWACCRRACAARATNPPAPDTRSGAPPAVGRGSGRDRRARAGRHGTIRARCPQRCRR